tara:strand:- start:22742 stop:23152 length:411 start_codon:yes stop_codon:yes gene_type:complete
MIAPADFPGILGEIAEVAGSAAALKIAHAKGGTRVSIPARPKDGHWLVETVGREAAERICDHFRTLSPEDREVGVRDVVMPLGPNGTMARAKRQVAVALAEGASVREAARRSGVHERTAWRIKAGADRDDGQGDLF